MGANYQNEYGDMEVRAGVYAEKKLLEHAQPILVLNKLADHKPMPKNSSDNVKWRRPIPLDTLTPQTPLVEGVKPNATQFRYDPVAATLSQYGAWTELTDKITDLHESDVGKDMSMMLGEQAAEVVELVTWGVIKGGLNVEWAASGTPTQTSDVTDTLSIGLQRKVCRTLMGNRAKRITSILDGSTKYATQPIEAGYVAVCHTDVAAQIRKMPGFVPVAEYGSRQPICAEEVGSVEDVRYICSPLFGPETDAGGTNASMKSTTGTNVDVYSVLYLAQHAFGAVALKGSKAFGGSIKPMLRNPGSPTDTDPLGQLGSVAWKTWYVAKILNDSWMVRAEIAVEKDPG